MDVPDIVEGLIAGKTLRWPIPRTRLAQAEMEAFTGAVRSRGYDIDMVPIGGEPFGRGQDARTHLLISARRAEKTSSAGQCCSSR